MKQIVNITGILLLMFFVNACYYDNMEELYPDTGSCDTTNVIFSTAIWPVLQSNCTGCHSGSAPSGNITIENYNDVVPLVHDGSLMGTIRFESGYTPMPKGGNKLSDCSITKLEIWINNGMPNN
jgi:hypothetical protein